MVVLGLTRVCSFFFLNVIYLFLYTRSLLVVEMEQKGPSIIFFPRYKGECKISACVTFLLITDSHSGSLLLTCKYGSKTWFSAVILKMSLAKKNPRSVLAVNSLSINYILFLLLLLFLHICLLFLPWSWYSVRNYVLCVYFKKLRFYLWLAFDPKVLQVLFELGYCLENK